VGWPAGQCVWTFGWCVTACEAHSPALSPSPSPEALARHPLNVADLVLLLRFRGWEALLILSTLSLSLAFSLGQLSTSWHRHRHRHGLQPQVLGCREATRKAPLVHLGYTHPFIHGLRLPVASAHSAQRRLLPRPWRGVGRQALRCSAHLLACMRTVQRRMGHVEVSVVPMAPSLLLGVGMRRSVDCGVAAAIGVASGVHSLPVPSAPWAPTFGSRAPPLLPAFLL